MGAPSLSTTRSTTVIDHAASGARSLRLGRGPTEPVIVDHDAGRILGVPLAEIGARPGAITRRLADAFLHCINTTAKAQPQQNTALVRKFRRAPPEAQDSFHGIFFGPDGSIEHLHGIHCPVVRLGHPPEPGRLRLNLINRPGTVIGHVKNGRIEGAEMLGDIHLLAAAPVPEWDDVRCALLSLAIRNPDSMGISVAYMYEPQFLPVGCDLVALPCIRNALLGYPRRRIESIGQPARATAGRIRALDLVYAWLAGRSTRA